MKSMLFCLALFLGLQGPSLMPPVNDNQAWESMARKLLARIFPEDAEKLKKLRFQFWDNPQPNSGVYHDVWGQPYLVIYSGIQKYVKTPERYACLLAHEFSHLKLELYENDKKTPEQNAQIEMVVDERAVKRVNKAGMSPCSCYRLLQDITSDMSKLPDWEQNRFRFLDRQENLAEMCAESLYKPRRGEQ